MKEKKTNRREGRKESSQLTVLEGRGRGYGEMTGQPHRQGDGEGRGVEGKGWERRMVLCDA